MKIKIIMAKFLALILLKNPVLEKLFCHLCSKPLLRKTLRLGGVAFGCVYALNKPEIRLAQLPGYKMYVNIAEPLGIRAYFFQDTSTLWLVSNLVDEGDICMDVGANMGHYTFLMASKVGTRGKVVAFEPQSNYFQMISNSIKLNNWEQFVSVENRAAWNISGEKLKFYLSDNPNNSGTSSLVNHGLFLNNDKTTRVTTISISDYLREARFSQCKLIKIDVERVELQVLQGMIALLESNSVDFIILEMYAHREAQKLLCKFGYSCFLLDSSQERIVPIIKIKQEHFGDYLFISPQAWKNFRECYAELML
ncbi:MAG: FkbM family methyltransferase [Coleofasciculus sp. D1-CHI-01]|uniref:FkbM family methyltransferase n=1 Tax=Coleofasciculus sp. D1-CHI-01 TaxID=3068482 RepID=UPI0032F6F2CF